MTTTHIIKLLSRLIAAAGLLALTSTLTSCSGVQWFPNGGPTTSFSSDFVNDGKPYTRKLW